VVLVTAVLVVGCGGAGGFGGGGGGGGHSRGGPVVVGHDVRPVVPRRGFGFFYCFSKVFAESYFCSRYMCAEWVHLALGIGLFAGPAVPGYAESTRACAERSSLSA
jgi:hypothetical protein